MKILKSLTVLALMAGFLGHGATGPAFADEVTLKLWSRADRSGPLRSGNIVKAAELLNKQFAAAGIDKTVKIKIHENTVRGYDKDALELMRAFAVDKAPDFYVTAHEWIGAFAEAGYAMDLEAHIAKYPEFYSDIIPVLWEATKYNGKRHAIPQDSEIRMFFFRKDMLRKLGKSDAFIEGLAGKVDKGEFTIWDLSKLAKEVVDKGLAKYGIIHRPNVGPDFLMTMASFGFDPFDEKTGKLQASQSALAEFLKWIAWNAKNGVTPRNNTAMSWATIHKLLPEAKAFIKHHGLWDVPRQIRFGVSENTEKSYTSTVGWIHSPAAKKGGAPANLSHPIVYVVNPKSKNRDLAALVIAIASQPFFNTQHAVASGHTPINNAQAAMPDYKAAWALRNATGMLNRALFMPNHPKIGRFNAIIYKGIQGVETGRISAKEGLEFILDELRSELAKDVIITK
jgi:inositol-phosphate transport system substrate-binding protein